MPILLSLLAAISAAAFFVIRARNAAGAAQDLFDVANDVRLAARRFGFRRRQNQHAVDCLDDQGTAIAAMGLAFIELGGMATQEQKSTLDISLRKHLSLDATTAEECMVLGHWLNTECGTTSAAFTRMGKRLYSIGGVQAVQPLLAVLNDATPTDGAMRPQQSEAIHEVKRIFRL
ncbi:MAG: hypothetical protein ACPGRD_07015 [Planktomarina sp.]